MPMPLACLVVADDLTGACDAAVHFAARGYSVRVCIDGHFPGVDVIAVSTESRALLRKELRLLLQEPLERYPAEGARVIFKKIDSTLRGNAGVETVLAAQVFGCDATVVTPAFPALGRVVADGSLRIAGADFEPLELVPYWQAQGVQSPVHVRPHEVGGAVAAGARFVSADACADADLDSIAAAGLASGKRILWAGSGGLAAALARALPAGTAKPAAHDAAHATMLFCIGSRHTVTDEQRRVLLESPRVFAAEANSASPESIAAALRDGHVALSIEMGQISEARVAELIGGLRAPLLLTGGDTAALVCRALGIHAITLEAEIAPGIPRGIIEGGAFDGLPVATKSGGFGRPDALIQVANALTCPKL